MNYTHREVMAVLSGLVLVIFLAAMDQNVVATAIYQIAQSLNGLTAQAWVTTAFLITSTITTPLYGKLSDQYGRKPLFLVAIAVFVAGSALCTVATSMYELAAYRAMQGVGAGGLFSLASTIIADIIPPRDRAKYGGYLLAVFTSASVLGPLVGGLLAGLDSFLGVEGWRWIFLMNIPVGVAAFAIVVKVLHLDHERRAHHLDFAGAAALVAATVPLLLVAEWGRHWGWGSGVSIICYAAGLLGFAAFLVAERRAGDEALLPLCLFRNRVFAVGAAQSTVIGLGMFGGLVLLPLYFQQVKGYAPIDAGMLTLPLLAGMLVFTFVSGQVTSRTGRYKILPLIGSVPVVAGTLMLWRLTVDSGLPYVGAAMFVLGAGLGLHLQTVVVAMQNAVPPQDIGVTTASATFFRQMGGTAGVAVFLSIVYSTAGDRIGAALAAARTTSAFQEAAQAHPDQLAALTAASTGGPALNDTSFLNGLDEVLAQPFKAGFTEALAMAFLVAAVVLVAAFFLALLMKEVPLRTTASAAKEAPEIDTEAV